MTLNGAVSWSWRQQSGASHTHPQHKSHPRTAAVFCTATLQSSPPPCGKEKKRSEEINLGGKQRAFSLSIAQHRNEQESQGTQPEKCGMSVTISELPLH